MGGIFGVFFFITPCCQIFFALPYPESPEELVAITNAKQENVINWEARQFLFKSK